MRAGAASGAPGRTSTARQPARYGIRWRTRDAARLVQYRTARTSNTAKTGIGWTAVGSADLVFNGALQGGAPGYWAGGMILAVGLGARLLAHQERQRR